jgi:hypothetical protein
VSASWGISGVGASDIVFWHAPKIELYTGWQYVLLARRLRLVLALAGTDPRAATSGHGPWSGIAAVRLASVADPCEFD